MRAYRTPGTEGNVDLLKGLERIRHLEVPHWHKEARAAGRVPELGVARRLKALIAGFRPDILQCGWLSDGGVLAALTGFHPLLMTPFGSDVLINPYRSPEHRWKARLALRCADAVTTDSLEVAQRVAQISGFPFGRIVRFPWGIDLGRFRPDAAREGFRARLGWEGWTVLVATRTLEPLYGTAQVLEALREVRRNRPEVSLVIVGDGSERAALEALARQPGLEGAVHFAGHVPNARLQGWLAESDLYVTGTRSDGTSRSLMEACACGLPVVVTDVPAIHEWIREGVQGAIVRRGDSADLALGISRVLDSPERGRMREAVLALAAERFDERRNLEKLEGMYRDLRAGFPSPPPPPPPPPLEDRGPLPLLDLESVRSSPFRYASFRARAAEWLVIAALWRRARASR